MVSAMQVTPVCGSTVDVSNLNLIVFLSNLLGTLSSRVLVVSFYRKWS